MPRESLVNDSHWLMRNLLAEELNPGAELLSGGPKRLSMVEGIDGGFDAAMFIGYHARAGTRNAMIDHTYTSRVYEARINGEPVGELALERRHGRRARRPGRAGEWRPGAGGGGHGRCWETASRP